MKVWSWMISRVSDLGGLALIVVAIFVFVDVIGRKVATSPVPGAFAYVEVALVLVIFSSLAIVEYQGKQIRFDFLSKRLKGRPMHVWMATVTLLSLSFFGLVAWQTSLDWWHSFCTDEFGYGVRIPMTIPRGMLVLGATLGSVELLRRFVSSVWHCLKK